MQGERLTTFGNQILVELSYTLATKSSKATEATETTAAESTAESTVKASTAIAHRNGNWKGDCKMGIN